MLHSTVGFVRRHQRKFVVIAGIAGGLYYVGHALSNKINEMQRQAKEDHISRENIKRRFEQNQRDCLFTILGLMPELTDQFFEKVNVDRLIEELRDMAKPVTPAADASFDNDENTPFYRPFQTPEKKQRTKAQIWEDIKLQSFTRTTCSTYVLSLLTILVHTQLNVVGRYTYIDSVVTQFEGVVNSDDEELPIPSNIGMDDQRHYLILSWWLLNRGWRILLHDIQDSIVESISGLQLKKKITFRELTRCFEQIRVKIEASGVLENLSKYLLPSNEAQMSEFMAINGLGPDQVITPTFDQLVNQTRDILESNDARLVLNSCLNRIFEQLLATLKENFPEPEPQPMPFTPLPDSKASSGPDGGLDLDKAVEEFEAFSVTPEPQVVVAQLLPRISRESNSILSSSQNFYLDELCTSREVQALAVSIYTAHGGKL
ncbi:peroxin [Mycoemilia scoparia]|uniref:Peroxin n=1 Tax=Mycoemilia scoparia TaxID=417184 RepID=A0A9W7ZM09_9FUNG|nr:peroxin [Mycoemilia scoparia]